MAKNNEQPSEKRPWATPRLIDLTVINEARAKATYPSEGIRGKLYAGTETGYFTGPQTTIGPS